MSKPQDPYYNRKSVPDEFIEHVGFTGLTSVEESTNRERKYSTQGYDVRKTWNPKEKDGKLDPYYQRKPVPDALIHGVGETGLSKEEEYLNRERKFSVNGDDVRRFGSSKSGFHPTNDPYYGRKQSVKALIDGVGDTNMSRAEEFHTRENKASLFDDSSDPFQAISGRGHRASVSAAVVGVAAEARRRSSAVAPDHVAAAHQATLNHNRHAGASNLAPIVSRQEEPDTIRPSTEGYPTTSTTTTTTTPSAVHHNGTPSNLGGSAQAVPAGDGTGHKVGDTGHTIFYDAATKDLDGVAPHEVR